MGVQSSVRQLQVWGFGSSPEWRLNPLCKRGGRHNKNAIFPRQFQCTLDVPADTTASTMTHPCLWKKSSRFSGFAWSPCGVLLPYGHGQLSESRLSRREMSADGRRGTSVGACVSVHAPLTSQTMPPLPHSQSKGAHSQMPSSSKPRLPCPSGWTSILPPMLLKTEPPTDATPCLIMY